LGGGVSVWETLERKPGRLRLRNRRLSGHHARLSRLADDLADIEGVEGCRVSSWFRSLTIELRPESPLADRRLGGVEQVLEPWPGVGVPVGCQSESSQRALVDFAPAGAGTRVAAGLSRLKCLALAGGAFALTVVAVVVPGIPTVPCLLATSYYL